MREVRPGKGVPPATGSVPARPPCTSVTGEDGTQGVKSGLSPLCGFSVALHVLQDSRPACAVTCASPPTWYKGPERPLLTDHIHQRADTGLHSAATCSDHPALKDVAAGAPREAAGMPPPPGARASQDTAHARHVPASARALGVFSLSCLGSHSTGSAVRASGVTRCPRAVGVCSEAQAGPAFQKLPLGAGSQEPSPPRPHTQLLREQWIRAKYERQEYERQEFTHPERQEPYSAGTAAHGSRRRRLGCRGLEDRAPESTVIVHPPPRKALAPPKVLWARRWTLVVMQVVTGVCAARGLGAYTLRATLTSLCGGHTWERRKEGLGAARGRGQQRVAQCGGSPGSPASAQTPAHIAGLLQPTGYREGFLWKRGRDNGQFLSRKFVLTEREGALKYFNRSDVSWAQGKAPRPGLASQAKEPKAIMKIEHLNATFQPAKIGHPHGLQVTYLKDNSTRNIFVYHEDGKEIVDWFNALRAARFHYLQVAFPGASDADEGYMEKTGPKSRNPGGMEALCAAG
ncbi:hypothetical protein CB1_000092017 [Camelus ferus]|nr:hypothetical protein CB1_000092017 [Camelus ferus]